MSCCCRSWPAASTLTGVRYSAPRDTALPMRPSPKTRGARFRPSSKLCCNTGRRPGSPRASSLMRAHTAKEGYSRTAYSERSANAAAIGRAKTHPTLSDLVSLHSQNRDPGSKRRNSVHLALNEVHPKETLVKRESSATQRAMVATVPAKARSLIYQSVFDQSRS